MTHSVENATDTTTATTEGTTAATTTAGTEADTTATTATTEGTTTTATTDATAKEGEGGDKTEADKTAEDKSKSGAPQTYEPFAMPEGVELDQAALERAVPLLKELDLPQEKAQKLATHFATELQQGVEAGVKATVESPEFVQGIQQSLDNQRDEEWIAAVKANPMIGGAKLDETKALALRGVDEISKAVKKFSGCDLKEALVETRHGNHPAYIGLFAYLGSLVKEDGGGLPAAAGGAAKTLANRIYDT
jgi:hypothetical protein